jgi:hypothetical protein
VWATGASRAVFRRAGPRPAGTTRAPKEPVMSDTHDDIQIFINEENDIFYADDEGEVNVTEAILEWLTSTDEEDDLEDLTADLVLVREAGKKLVDAAQEKIAELTGKK